MVTLNDLMDIKQLEEYILHGIVSEQSHPDFNELRILNYTHRCQNENIWDNITEQTRGLIYNKNNGEIIARCFRKFFNFETSFREETKLENLPKFQPTVFEKVDGSLGITYKYKGEWRIATRGSFSSPQAIWATNWLKTNDIGYLSNYETVLFEIVYDENRIVVNYDFEGLVLLGIVDIETGFEAPPYVLQTIAKQHNLHCAKEYTKTLDECLGDNTPNTEGFVLQYWDKKGPIPLRIKIKTEDYVRLHKVITGLNIKGVWEHLKVGNSPEALYMPAIHNTNFVSWCVSSIHSLQASYKQIEDNATRIFGEVMIDVLQSAIDKKNIKRKEYAIRFIAKNPRLSSVLFLMLDGRDFKTAIWDLIEPKIIDGESLMRNADDFNGL